MLELKLDKTYRDIITQVPDYGSSVRDLDDDRIAQIFDEYQKRRHNNKEMITEAMIIRRSLDFLRPMMKKCRINSTGESFQKRIETKGVPMTYIKLLLVVLVLAAFVPLAHARDDTFPLNHTAIGKH